MNSRNRQIRNRQYKQSKSSDPESSVQTVGIVRSGIVSKNSRNCQIRNRQCSHKLKHLLYLQRNGFGLFRFERGLGGKKLQCCHESMMMELSDPESSAVTVGIVRSEIVSTNSRNRQIRNHQ